MSYFDLALIIIIAGFALFGLWFGLVHTLGSLIGTILGVFLAARWYAPFAAWLIGITGWNSNFARVLTFVIAFVLINRLVGLAFFLIDKALALVTRLPFIHSLDKLLGGVFGFLEGVLVIGVALYFINKYPLSPSFMNQIATSKIAPFCIALSSVLWPLMPEALKQIQNSLQKIF